MKKRMKLCAILLLLSLLLTACTGPEALPASSGTSSQTEAAVQTEAATQTEAVRLDAIPEYAGEPYVVLADNVPDFSDYTTESFEHYSELDSLGRCGPAYACIGQDLMPTEERGAIGQVKPTGWHTVKYDLVDGKYLYNRCHLIGYQLSGENANEKNLMTGTRYLNVDGMLPFENMVADYVKETGCHVLYRVTPVFEGDDLLARGVELEGLSVEDQGAGIQFHVFCYNVQPGVEIDYTTGESRLAEQDAGPEDAEEATYILNTNTRKFHLPDCSSVQDIQEDNCQTFTGSRQDLLEEGYSPCGRCKP